MKKRRYLPLVTALLLAALAVTACGMVEDTTPADTTPAVTTPADTTPIATTPADTTPADTTPAVTTPADTGPCDHRFGAWRRETDPDCLKEGEDRRICDLCGLAETKAVPALGHEIILHEGKEATCLQKGWDAYETCGRCDYSTYREYMGDHSFLHGLCYYCGLKEDGTAYVFGSFYDSRGNASHMGAPDLATYSMSLYTPVERRLFCSENGSQMQGRFYVRRKSYVFSEVLQEVVLAEDARIFYTNNQQTEILSYEGVRYEYDDRGNITLEAVVDEAGNRLRYYEREYVGTSLTLERHVMEGVIVRESRYDGDFLTEETRREEDGTFLYYKKCTKREDGTYTADYYDEAGVYFQREEATALGHVYYTEVYDGEGRVIQRIEVEDFNHVYTYTYDWSTGESLLIRKVYKHSYDLLVHAYEREDYEYEDGRLTRTLYRDEEGTLLGTMECVYNESGLLTGELYRDGEGNLTAEKTYDDEGRLLSRRVMGEESYTLSYTYYPSGLLQREEKRDAEGNLLSARDYEYDADGKLSGVTETDAQGNRLDEVWYVTEDGEIRVDTLTYDSHGRVIRRETTNELGGLIALYTYAYGEDGTMTERVTTIEGKALHTHEYFAGGLLVKLEEVYPGGNVFTTAYYTYGEDGVLQTKEIYSSFDICKERVEYYPSGQVKVRETYSSTSGNHTGDTGYAEDGTELWRREYQYYTVLQYVTYREFVTIGGNVYDALVRRQVYGDDGVTLTGDSTTRYTRREDGSISAASIRSEIGVEHADILYDEQERTLSYKAKTLRGDGTVADTLWEYTYTASGEQQQTRDEEAVFAPDGTPLSYRLITYAYEPGKIITNDKCITYENGVVRTFAHTEKTVRATGGLMTRFVTFDENGAIIQAEEYSYNTAGHPLKILVKDGEGNLIRETVNVYGSQGLNSTTVKDGEGNVLSTDRYSHDVDIYGRTLRETVIYEGERVVAREEKEYARNAPEVVYYHQRRIYGEDGETVIDYYLIEREYMGRKIDQEIEKDENGAVRRKRKVTYADSRPSTDTTTYYDTDGETILAQVTTSYAYDEAGYLLTETDLDQAMNMLRFKEYRYQPMEGFLMDLGSLETHYDGAGNVTGTVETVLTDNQWPDLTVWKNGDGVILRMVDQVYEMEGDVPVAHLYTVETVYGEAGNALFSAIYDPTGKLLRIE